MEMYGYTFIRESDLMHHGIKGQKWGVRRFQNEDGTWTNAGKNRYDVRADKREAAKNRHIDVIGKSKTRVGKWYHNERAFVNQTRENVNRDKSSSKTLSEKIGSRVGYGKAASISDAAEDFYTRQKDYRTTKLGKHLSGVHEYNAHNLGTSSERVYQSKGAINKAKKIVKGTFATDIKTIVGRKTKTGEHIVTSALQKYTKVNVSTIVDIGYLGKKVLVDKKK